MAFQSNGIITEYFLIETKPKYSDFSNSILSLSANINLMEAATTTSKYVDFMVDLETLGISTNSAIAQMAIVKFDIATKTILEHLVLDVDYSKEYLNGFIFRQKTLDWWYSLPNEVKNKVFDESIERIDPKLAFEKLLAFIKKDNKEYRLWCHANFDEPLISEHLRAYNLEPLSYKAVRDLRTIVDLANLDLNSYPKYPLHHYALSDCYFQIDYVCDAYAKLSQLALK